LSRPQNYPYKLLVLMLYKSMSGVRHLPTGGLTVHVPKLAQSVKCTSHRLRAAIKYLADHGYIADLVLQHGRADFSLKLPGVTIDVND
jgi:hypothetical protein